ncbi:MAG: phosphoribosyl-AMP cyclohydrolase [Proteobacteria bacterium]|nr:phosphoribosyl-AMP cyclohydrolase [Pseudomonadota bacterium]
MEFPQIKFDERGLVPAVVQDIKDGAVLMVAYMNRESLELTLRTGFATFYSRSRKKLWKKGEESGNVLKVKEVYYDCDGDCILVKAEPAGPTCHTGNRACFYRRLEM